MDLSGNPIKTKGLNWTKQNTMTLLKWVSIGSYYINVLERSIVFNRHLIRINTIQSIIMTTATGSIGISQISSIFPQQLEMILTLLFTFMSFFLTITTGILKVFLVHENLEKYIQVKQEWTSFITSISTELQLPSYERQDALILIRDNKSVYLSLLNKDIELSKLLAKDAKRAIKYSVEMAMKKYNDARDYDEITSQSLSEYYRMISSTGISISDITNYIVKTEITDIVGKEVNERKYKEDYYKEREQYRDVNEHFPNIEYFEKNKVLSKFDVPPPDYANNHDIPPLHRTSSSLQHCRFNSLESLEPNFYNQPLNSAINIVKKTLPVAQNTVQEVFKPLTHYFEREMRVSTLESPEGEIDIPPPLRRDSNPSIEMVITDEKSPKDTENVEAATEEYSEEHETRSDGERRAYSGSAKQRMSDEYDIETPPEKNNQ